jgi:putative transposase
MARALRIDYPGAFYHVLNRGQRREPIFQDDRDRERFVELLERMAGLFAVRVHGYCLMTNHYHAILETPEGNLSRAMHWLHVSYAAAYNRRHRCSGHVFQGRFKAVLVDAGNYLDCLSRYVHRNPVRAGLAARPWEYPWSSCRHFVRGKQVPAWLEVGRILAGFGPTRAVARRRYAAYVSESDPANPFDDVVGGSVLGSEPFLQWLRHAVLPRPRRTRDVPGYGSVVERPSVDRIVAEVAACFGTTMEHIRSPGHKRNQARDAAIYLSRELAGLRCRELGGYFGGITGAAITIRCGQFTQCLAKDRRLAKKMANLRRRISNS